MPDESGDDTPIRYLNEEIPTVTLPEYAGERAEAEIQAGGTARGLGRWTPGEPEHDSNDTCTHSTLLFLPG